MLKTLSPISAVLKWFLFIRNLHNNKVVVCGALIFSCLGAECVGETLLVL